MLVPVLPLEVKAAGTILLLVERKHFVFMWKVQYAKTTN